MDKQKSFDIGIAREINGGIRPGVIKTRDGFNVRIVSWNAKGRFPIVGLVDMVNAEYARQWTENGSADLRPNIKSNYDLVIEEEGGGQ